MRVQVRVHPPSVVDLRRTLGLAFRFPIAAWRGDTLWRATRTPAGPATIRMRPDGPAVEVTAWGPGAAWAVANAPAALGSEDDATGFDAKSHPLVSLLHELAPGLRIPRTQAVFETLVPAILEQKVQGIQARRAFRALVARFGEDAPGPGRSVGVRLMPSAQTLARRSPWDFHRFNVESRRAATIITAARFAENIEECAALALPAAYERLQTLPGIGPWTAAEVAVHALGDPDAVSVGDFHLPNTIAYALAGEARGDDARMLELLEPWRGNRARVVKLIEGSGVHAPRFGPRLALHDITRL